MTITIETTPELQEQIEHAAAQAGLTPDVYIVETLRDHLTQPVVSSAQGPASAQHLAPAEANLLLKINQSLAGIPWARYHTLISKRRAETLTPDERQELITLSDQIETANAQRMTYLVELARLRKISLPTLIQELGLKPKGDV